MQFVDYESRGRIAWVTLRRPEAMNAINRQMNSELWDVWQDFQGNPELDVAVLTGAGNQAFCAGADLADYIPPWLDKTMLDVRRNVGKGLGAITRGLHRVYKPIIAAVNGWALAGGFELALACDIRIASTNARFGSFEVRRGFHHGDGGIVRLVASIGLAGALELVLTGREIDAEEALRRGLVSQVVEGQVLQETAQEWANRILENSQTAVRSAKETILEVYGRTLDDALRVEALYGYSSGDKEDVRKRLEEFFSSHTGDTIRDRDDS